MTELTLAGVDQQTLRLWNTFTTLEMVTRRQALAKGRVETLSDTSLIVTAGKLVVNVSGRIAVRLPDMCKGSEVLRPGDLLLASRATELEALCPSEAFVIDAEVWNDVAGDAGREFLHQGVCARADRLERLLTCVGHHTVIQRLADLLKMMEPIADKAGIPLEQVKIGTLLAVQRTTVNKAAGELVASGFTRTVRSHVQIKDLEGLRSVACGCRTSQPRRAVSRPSDLQDNLLVRNTPEQDRQIAFGRG